jgi:hypothetical protein
MKNSSFYHLIIVLKEIPLQFLSARTLISMIVSTIEVTFEDLSDRDASVTYSSFSTREIFESYSRLRAFLFSSEMIRVIISMTACTILIAMSCSTNVRACNRVFISKFLLWDLNNVTWEMNDMTERNENSKKNSERWEKEDDRVMILLYHAKILKYTLAWTFSVILRIISSSCFVKTFIYTSSYSVRLTQ